MTTPDRRLYRRADAADYLGISLRALDALAADGVIPKVNVFGSRIAYDRVDLDRYVDQIKRTGGRR